MFAELWNLIFNQATTWLNSAIDMLPQLIVAVIILILTFLIAKFFKKIVRRSVMHVSSNSGIRKLLSNTIYIGIMFGGLFISLSVLNLDKTVTSLLAGVGIVGLALGFAFQDIAANYISGIIIAFQQPFKKGDLLRTNDYFGKVHAIDLRSTQITTLDGLDVIIPNKDVLQNPLTNYTRTENRRVDLTVGISYAENLERSKEITLKAVSKVKPLLHDKPVELFYDEFGDSSINFVVRFWIKESTQAAFREARSQAIMNIKKAYDKEGISIPFPIRTLDFGIKGGKDISEMKKTTKKTKKKTRNQ